jgi:hypothetical protein
VNGLRVVGIGHRQPVGDAEDRQRDQPLRRRRQVPQFAVLVLKLQRRRAPGAMLLQVGKGDGQAQAAIPAPDGGQRAAIKAVETVVDQRLSVDASAGWRNRLPATGGWPSTRRFPRSRAGRGVRRIFRRGAGLGGRHRRAVCGIANGILQQAQQRFPVSSARPSALRPSR